MEDTNKKQLISQVQTAFIKQFEIKPKYLTLTPGRINIIGEHTDYNEGLAMPTAINRWICSATTKTSNQSFTIYSLNYNERLVLIEKKSEIFREIWKQLANAAVKLLKKRFKIDAGVNMVIGGNIPIGCGLSSSSAFVISIVHSICQLFSINIKARDLAVFCQKIENQALGTASGRLDQYGIILSRKDHFMLIDFKDDNIEYIPVVLNNCTWIIVNSQIPRQLSESAYLQRVKESQQGFYILKQRCNISSLRDIDRAILEILKQESSILYKRLCHIMDENQRVLYMKDQLLACNAKRAGDILRESHKSLKFLYEVSCKEIDYIIEISENIDVWYGGRIMGGGFGGCSIHLVDHEGVEGFIDYITINYKEKFGITPKIIIVTYPGGLEQM